MNVNYNIDRSRAKRANEKPEAIASGFSLAPPNNFEPLTIRTILEGFFRAHEKTPIPESSIHQGIITIYQTAPPILQTRLSLYDRVFDSDAVFTDNVRKIVRSQPDGCRVVIRVNADHSPDKFRIDINAHFPRAAVHHHERAYGTECQPEDIP